ncbi:MAG: DUF4434 domain-containing protein [Bryobacteraceae bacterium]|nr:DUF4434 domain-containing protein [Bryobacteraceae bacterium]
MLLTLALVTTSFAGDLSPAAANADRRFPLRGSFLTFDRDMPHQQWAKELDFMKDVDMDTIVVLSVGRLRSNPSDPLGYSLSGQGLLFPSRWVPAERRPVEDRLEMILTLADEREMKVYAGSLQTEGDWTTGCEFAALREYNKRVAAEIVERYGAHPSLVGWYFPQELWMNWAGHYGPGYYGSKVLGDFVADMKKVDPGRVTAATVVFKKDGAGPMPGMTPGELRRVMEDFLRVTRVDVLMPQDGVGAGAGAPSIEELPAYFAAMSAAREAAGVNAEFLAIVETFAAEESLGDDRYPPARMSRVARQVNAVRPFVDGAVSWIFGRDMSPQATHYPREAGALYREYRYQYGKAPSIGPLAARR